jgi:Uma2 family endonuclease
MAERETGMAVTLQRRRFTVDEYHRMGEAGILGEDDRVEQNPLLVAALRSESQPDVTLLAPRQDFYASRLPEPADVRLLVEVADPSFPYERRTKIPLHARAGVPEIWLAVLEVAQVEVHRGPSGSGYAEVRSPAPGERFAPLAFPDLSITATDLLG